MDVEILSVVRDSVFFELESAKRGKKSSIPYLVHHFDLTPEAQDRQTIQVCVVGGRVGNIAVVRRTGTGVDVVKHKDVPVPSLGTKRDTLSFISSHVYKGTKILAVNFAFPMRPVYRQGRLDGLLLRGTKEHMFRGLIGERVGDTIERYLYTNRRQRVEVCIANDAICLLLSGLYSSSWIGRACGIVGSGVNFAYFLDARQAVNLEAGFFDKFPLSDTGKLIDRESFHKGYSLFEKEVGGAYLYRHFNLLIQLGEVDAPVIQSTEELSVVASSRRHKGYSAARMLLDRSAGLVAAYIAGVVLHRSEDMDFLMEGSVFWNGWRYRQSVGRYLSYLCPGHRVRFLHQSQSAVLGASRLVFH